MRYITKQELQSKRGYPLLERAISYPYRYDRKCAPFTKDGRLTVAAIYNMSAWASWKSSSLDDRDRAIAEAILGIPLHELMRLNEGRRGDQPALFPDGRDLPAPEKAKTEDS